MKHFVKEDNVWDIGALVFTRGINNSPWIDPGQHNKYFVFLSFRYEDCFRSPQITWNRMCSRTSVACITFHHCVCPDMRGEGSVYPQFCPKHEHQKKGRTSLRYEKTIVSIGPWIQKAEAQVGIRLVRQGHRSISQSKFSSESLVPGVWVSGSSGVPLWLFLCNPQALWVQAKIQAPKIFSQSGRTQWDENLLCVHSNTKPYQYHYSTQNTNPNTNTKEKTNMQIKKSTSVSFHCLFSDWLIIWGAWFGSKKSQTNLHLRNHAEGHTQRARASHPTELRLRIRNMEVTHVSYTGVS